MTLLQKYVTRNLERMPHQTLNYIDILHSHGCRVTHQRRVILDAICAGRTHTTFGEIYTRVREIDDSIDRSTLYRTLELFLDLGLIVSAERDQGEKVYEIIKPEPHHHLICKHCGLEIEIDHDIVKDLFESIWLVHQFSIQMDHLTFYGSCPQCETIEN